MEETAVIRVLIADELELLRAGLACILQSTPGLVLAGQAANGEEAIAAAQTAKPDVVLMDMNLPDMDGFRATRELLRSQPSVRVLLLATDLREDTLVKAISAGAAGYILKNAPPSELVEGIQKAHRGEYVVPSQVTVLVVRRLLREYGEKGEFTPRETDILRWLTTGATNKQLAQALGISVSTVGNYIQRLLKKLGLENRAQLAAYAVREGYQLDPQEQLETRW
ncbi:response regulator [Alicyclobacillus shizuokensis]|uniref:response regulator n=1 Tax=Alicyclobacillus shizuokensis TaxID=392014 RepID=UPI00083197FF|nr:response regulator transcription factor [Alicyclobacillus shizuokensis]